MMKRARILPLLCALTVSAGCAQPPAEQINAAEQAVKDAQQSGAATYAPDDYAKLEGALSAIKKEVADQDAKFALFRDYGKVEQLAATTKAEADRVKTEAVKKMEAAKTAAVEAQHEAQDAVKITMDLVAKAPTGKDRAALESIKHDADALRASLNDVQMMMDKSDYLAAKTKANAVRDKSRAVSQEIEQALVRAGKMKHPVARNK